MEQRKIKVVALSREKLVSAHRFSGIQRNDQSQTDDFYARIKALILLVE